MKPKSWLMSMYHQLVLRSKRSLRTQLILTFVVCLLLSNIAAILANSLTEALFRQAAVDYSSGRNNIEDVARNLTQSFAFTTEGGVLDVQKEIDEVTERNRQTAQIGDLRIMVVDSTGKVLYKSSKVKESAINLHDVLWEALDHREGDSYQEAGEAIYAYPTEIEGQHGFVIVRGEPKPSISYYPSGNPVPVWCYSWCFSSCSIG
ncbi:hypothetical protein [Tumebacillus permanentifrigoris]|uniref:Single cache domain-containing protein n=1 Tax=Tumebacillus permanentifrigoris TaxID=378543 RepID=A0A316DFH5_9BACL|nr:hypothetical protein [Tumebacillus permanentifrigoris]PWK15959.1 hypothetical protein C7459_102205 [Tumebacillus permanentifrigoris]